MFLEIIRSEGLSHLSYILGDGDEAAVIDPRRDCQIYQEIAFQKRVRINYIFETHRNEDYVIGSSELAHSTKAEIYHGRNLPFKYGNAVLEGDIFDLGDIRLTVLETPGHTYESISLVLTDKGFSDEPVAVFTGDALFIGDVGRTDFFPDKKEEVAGFLFDSIFDKILALGDHVILYPAHGAGSVCGVGMASREFSTLGYERKNNPMLQKKRDDFIEYKISEHHYKPPYFRMMEKYNLDGAPLLVKVKHPNPLNIRDFTLSMKEGLLVLDVRSPEAFAGAYIPGSIAIPVDMIPAFAGWLLPYDNDIILIAERYDQVKVSLTYLSRLGYDNVRGYFEGGLHLWEMSGLKYGRIPAIHAGEIVERLNTQKDFTLLDVRTKQEFESGHLPNAYNIYVGELPDRLEEVPRDRPVTTFCGSGQRAIIAASILAKNGFTDVEDCLGSMMACSAIGCPIITKDSD